jgi:hypothetical protein
MLARAWMSSLQLRFWEYSGIRATGFMAKEKNPHAVALSKLGAKKGGKARAAALSAESRRDIARKASLARWAKEKKKKESS